MKGQEGTALQGSGEGQRAVVLDYSPAGTKSISPRGCLTARAGTKVSPGSCGCPLLCPSCCCDRTGGVCSKDVEAGDAAPKAPAAPLSFPGLGPGMCLACPPWWAQGCWGEDETGERMEASRGSPGLPAPPGLRG